MAVVAEHHEPDMPMVATTGGLAQGAPWSVTLEQEAILTRSARSDARLRAGFLTAPGQAEAVREPIPRAARTMPSLSMP